MLACTEPKFRFHFQRPLRSEKKKNIKRGKEAIINCAFNKMFRVTLIVYLRCKTHFFHACTLLCLSECDKISRWPVLHIMINIMYQRKYFCINIKFPNVLDSKHIFPYWFKYICKKPTFSGFLYKKLVFSLPKNVTKSAVRNFLSAFGAPGEFIISLLLPGGLSYLWWWWQLYSCVNYKIAVIKPLSKDTNNKLYKIINSQISMYKLI